MFAAESSLHSAKDSLHRYKAAYTSMPADRTRSFNGMQP